MKIFNMKWLAVVGIILIGGLSAFTISEMNNKVEETVESIKQTDVIFIPYDINQDPIGVDPGTLPIPPTSNPYNCPQNGDKTCSRGYDPEDLELIDGMLFPKDGADHVVEYTWNPPQ